MKLAFTETNHCRSHRHCKACLGREGFREKLAKAFIMPPDWPACPHGATLDDLPEPRRAMPEWFYKRVKACAECANEDCFIKHTFGCVRRKWLKQEEMLCPRDQWLTCAGPR